MKGWVLGFVFFGCLANISAQNKNLCGATYFDSIPLYIESNLYETSIPLKLLGKGSYFAPSH